MAHFVCPWWFGYFLISPLRRFAHDPDRIVSPFLKPGMTTVDFGCGMGHFSLAMARLVGPDGRVVCIDLQNRMLAGLRRRAAKAGLSDRLDIRQVREDDTGVADLAGQVDFVLAMYVVHEVKDKRRLLKDLASSLKPDGRLLLAEPFYHVRRESFRETAGVAEEAGLVVLDRPEIRSSRAVLLGRREASFTSLPDAGALGRVRRGSFHVAR